MNNSISKNKNVASKNPSEFRSGNINSWWDDFISGVSDVVDVAAKILPLLPDGKNSTDPPPTYTTGPISWTYDSTSGLVTAQNTGNDTVTLCFTTGINGDQSGLISLDQGQTDSTEVTGFLTTYPNGQITISAANKVPDSKSIAWSITDLVFPTDGEVPSIVITSDITLFTGHSAEDGNYISLKSAGGNTINGSMVMLQAQGTVFNMGITPGPSTKTVLPPGIELTENLILSSLALTLLFDSESYKSAVAKKHSRK
jgi:hypothetical protein